MGSVCGQLLPLLLCALLHTVKAVSARLQRLSSMSSCKHDLALACLELHPVSSKGVTSDTHKIPACL